MTLYEVTDPVFPYLVNKMQSKLPTVQELKLIFFWRGF